VGLRAKAEKFNDLPAQYRKNVNTSDAPLDRTSSQMPAWNERDIDDVIAFLKEPCRSGCDR
jgi:cytochrome c peroxidase